MICSRVKKMRERNKWLFLLKIDCSSFLLTIISVLVIFDDEAIHCCLRANQMARVCASFSSVQPFNFQYNSTFFRNSTRLPIVAVEQWLRASNTFRQICWSTSEQCGFEWRGFESHWFCRSGFQFAKIQLSILNH